MSWDKNTISVSGVDTTIEVLDALNEPYQISIIATFRGMGLNDVDDELRVLRRLQHTKGVVLEYVEMDMDCDVDDVISSQVFSLEDEPKDWEAIRKTDIFGDKGDEIEL